MQTSTSYTWPVIPFHDEFRVTLSRVKLIGTATHVVDATAAGSARCRHCCRGGASSVRMDIRIGQGEVLKCQATPQPNQRPPRHSTTCDFGTPSSFYNSSHAPNCSGTRRDHPTSCRAQRSRHRTDRCSSGKCADHFSKSPPCPSRSRRKQQEAQVPASPCSQQVVQPPGARTSLQVVAVVGGATESSMRSDWHFWNAIVSLARKQVATYERFNATVECGRQKDEGRLGVGGTPKTNVWNRVQVQVNEAMTTPSFVCQ